MVPTSLFNHYSYYFFKQNIHEIYFETKLPISDFWLELGT